MLVKDMSQASSVGAPSPWMIIFCFLAFVVLQSWAPTDVTSTQIKQTQHDASKLANLP